MKSIFWEQKWQSRITNPETKATLGRAHKIHNKHKQKQQQTNKQTNKQTNNKTKIHTHTTQFVFIKDDQYGHHHKPRMNSSLFYKTSTVLAI